MIEEALESSGATITTTNTVHNVLNNAVPPEWGSTMAFFRHAFAAAAAAAEEKEGAASSGEDSESAVHGFEQRSLGVLFLTMLIFLGGTFFMTHKKSIPLPYTVVLFLYGIVVGAIALWIMPDVANSLGSIPPELLFSIFLPVLIFEGSYAMNIHALLRVVWQTALLATVGIIINTLLLGTVARLLFSGWSWYASLLLGSLLSATDPVAVVSLLKNLGVDKCITAMVDGEAVMNDGTAIIAFVLLLPAAKAGAFVMSGGMIFLKCLQLSVLPIIVGPLFGFLQSFWLRRAPDGLTMACITVSVTYVSYHIAAHIIGTSGVLTLFFQGTFLSYYCPQLFPGREGNLIYSTWEFLVHLGNTVLFSLVGVILVADVLPTLQPVDVFVILVLYIAMILARLVMLEALMPILNLSHSFKLTQNTLLLMVHAGLRGGVAATLALVVYQERLEEGIPILKVTCGVVLLTLLINATTSEYVVGLLGLRCKEEHRIAQMDYAVAFLVDTEERVLQELKRDTKYRNANWLAVEKFVATHMRNPYSTVDVIAEDDDVALNRLLMSAFKASVWRQRDEGIISETVAIELTNLAAQLIERGELLDVHDLQFFHKKKRSSAHRRARAGAAPAGSRTTSVVGRSTEIVIEGLPPPFTATALEDARLDDSEPESPHHNLDLNVQSPPDQPTAQDDEGSDTMVEALMQRVLPYWVVLAERFIFGKGYFASAHRRAQENAFMEMLAVVKCLKGVAEIKYQYVRNQAQGQRVERWLSGQLNALNAAIRFFYAYFPEATNTVASTRAVLSVTNHLLDAVETLHEEYGFGIRVVNSLEEMVSDIRRSVPASWDTDARDKESNLVLRAVAATTLGKGLRRQEIVAISTMGLVRRFHENDIITLPHNAFLVVVFGTLRALHGAWTTISEHQLMESFGDTVGLDSFLLPPELLKGRQRRWRVVSTDATALLISFNSIKPFLNERSLRAVKALWRAAAAEVLYPFLDNMITLPERDESRLREVLISMLMQGTPLIGPQDCSQFDWSSQFHLCFYLRGTDTTGFFNGHTPPCYVSTFFASQLEWKDPQTVLYAVPVNVSDCGYVPWSTGFGGPAASTTTAATGSPVGTSYGAAPPLPSPSASTQSGSTSTRDAQDRVRVGRGSHGRLSSSAGSGLPPGTAAGDATTEEEEGEEMLPRGHGSSPSAASGTSPRASGSPSRRATAGASGATTSGDAAYTSGMSISSVGGMSTSHAFLSATHAGATNILTTVLQGKLPHHDATSELDTDDDGDEEENLEERLHTARTRTPFLRRNTVMGTSEDRGSFPTREDSEVAGAGGASGELNYSINVTSPSMIRPIVSFSDRIVYDATSVSVFQRLSEFVSPVPYVNQLIARYATALEQLCIAALRYVRYPDDPLHLTHAQRVSETVLEYLLSFGLELALIKRTGQVLNRKQSAEAQSLLKPFQDDDVDAAFQCLVCAWMRQASITNKHHLRNMIVEMNAFANKRVPMFVAMLKIMVTWEPALKKVESVEGMQLLALEVRQSEHI